jgi:hypothetical protein
MMDRRAFLKAAGAVGVAVHLPMTAKEFVGEDERIRLPKMAFTWQKWQTTRPFTPDVDPEGKIWFGSDKFFCYDPGLGTTQVLDNSPLEGKPYSTCLCQGEKVYALTQKSPTLYVYNQRTKRYVTHALPDPESNIWFGARVPGDPRLYLYVRNRGTLVVWDTELEKGKEIPYPESLDLWSGFYVKDDDALYSFTLDAKPCRLIRFDLTRQRFDAIISGPEPGCEITGVNPVGGRVFCADRFTGRLFPFDFVRRKWEKAIPVPGYGTVFGFIGMGTAYRGLALYCLSTYRGKMTWDFDRNTYLSTGDENIGIDGRPHHFINKYLAYDPTAEDFGFLEAPARSKSRYPLICYSIVARDRLFITGYDLGNISRGMAPMGEKAGELCMFHSID